MCFSLDRDCVYLRTGILRIMELGQPSTTTISILSKLLNLGLSIKSMSPTPLFVRCFRTVPAQPPLLHAVHMKHPPVLSGALFWLFPSVVRFTFEGLTPISLPSPSPPLFCPKQCPVFFLRPFPHPPRATLAKTFPPHHRAHPFFHPTSTLSTAFAACFLPWWAPSDGPVAAMRIQKRGGRACERI